MLICFMPIRCCLNTCCGAWRIAGQFCGPVLCCAVLPGEDVHCISLCCACCWHVNIVLCYSVLACNRCIQSYAMPICYMHACWQAFHDVQHMQDTRVHWLFLHSLVFSAAYGANAIVAKTNEELEDRDAALYGDYSNEDDIKINMPGNAQGNGGEVEMQTAAGNRDSIDSRFDGRNSVDGHANGHHNRQSLDSLDQAESGGMNRQLSMQREQSTALTGITLSTA